MHRLKIEARGYLMIEVIADTPDKVREDTTQLLHREGKKRGWSADDIQAEIDKVEDNRTVIEDLTGGFILVDYERAFV